MMSSTELDNEQKSQFIRLIREQKKYGLVWEDSTKDAWEKMKTTIPVLNEVDDTKVIPFIVSEIAQRGEQEQPLKIYIFADGAYPYTDDFASVVDKVSLIPMPYAYYRGIKDSLPEETITKVDDTELTDEEQQTMMAEAIAFESKEEI